jgi:hypothetical protein
MFADLEQLGVKPATIERIRKLMPGGAGDPLTILAALHKAIEEVSATKP